MGEYSRTMKEEDAWLWCFKNQILIQPRQIAANVYKWYVDIYRGPGRLRKKIGTSPEPYGPVEVWKKVSEYQSYYYNKYKDEK